MFETDAPFLCAGRVFSGGLFPVCIGKDELQIAFPVLTAILQRDDMIRMRRFPGLELAARDGAAAILAKE